MKFDVDIEDDGSITVSRYTAKAHLSIYLADDDRVPYGYMQELALPEGEALITHADLAAAIKRMAEIEKEI
jgi:hypothetical protein